MLIIFLPDTGPVSYTIQVDHSDGQGHCWRRVEEELDGDLREEIATEILGGNHAPESYRAANGRYYRWLAAN